MIAQSLGGMEIVVGMSSLTGGLVLDKSELVQGSKLSIKYLFTLTPVPLTSNVYHVGQSINTISRHCENYAIVPLFFLNFSLFIQDLLS